MFLRAIEGSLWQPLLARALLEAPRQWQRRHERRQQAVLRALPELAGRFRAASLPFLLLKGPYLTARFYGHVLGREFGVAPFSSTRKRHAVLSDEHEVIFAAVSLLRDVERGRPKMKDVVGLVQLAAAVDADLDWRAMLAARDGTAGPLANVLALCLEVAGAHDLSARLSAPLAVRGSVQAVETGAATQFEPAWLGLGNKLWAARAYDTSLPGWLLWSMASLPFTVSPLLHRQPLQRPAGLVPTNLREYDGTESRARLDVGAEDETDRGPGEPRTARQEAATRVARSPRRCDLVAIPECSNWRWQSRPMLESRRATRARAATGGAAVAGRSAGGSLRPVSLRATPADRCRCRQARRRRAPCPSTPTSGPSAGARRR